ncbi:hypothetical protein [Rhizobium leguminosarum]|uniref:hypothetical protein n=1 Tax=Rhizobium leguminosarum TaxID=384 RepID=UPI003ECF6057
MTATGQNEKGSATAPTVPSHGSRSLTKETKMNNSTNIIASVKKLVLTRRSALGFLVASAVPSGATAMERQPPIKPAKERAEHHLNELRAALEEAFDKPFSAEILWDVEAAVLFGRTVRT